MSRFGDGLDFAIRPKPTAHEREVLVRALVVAGFLKVETQPSAWWLEGLREAREGEAADAPCVGPRANPPSVEPRARS